MNCSPSALQMLRDLLTEQEERISDAGPETDDQLQLDLESLNELWTIYQSLIQ
jgi:hypothetical protein